MDCGRRPRSKAVQASTKARRLENLSRRYDGVAANQDALGRSDAGGFANVVRDDDGAAVPLRGGADGASVDSKALADADKKALSNYARDGVFYGFPKPAPLPTLADASFLD